MPCQSDVNLCAGSHQGPLAETVKVDRYLTTFWSIYFWDAHCLAIKFVKFISEVMHEIHAVNSERQRFQFYEVDVS